jgi:hypothetical protein
MMAALYYIFTIGGRYYSLSVEELNRQLINNQFTVLQGFLTDADVDFKIALLDAVDQINGASNKVIPEITVIQNRLEQKIYNNVCHYFTEYNGAVLSGTNELRGKQAGVLSKKQILILFDLLADKGGIERIDYKLPNKFESVAELFHGLNGKSKSTWEEELKDCKNKGLYYYNDKGELNQLIKDISSLSNKARKAGFRTLATAADKKIKELESVKRLNSWE